MLIPREKPYLEGLNSYYLQLEKFIEHMQGDIGSGGIHCKSLNVEMLIYFNEQETISTLVQKKNEKAGFISSYEIARNIFYDDNFAVRVFQLDDHAIFFWAQMPSFQRAKASLKSTEIPLPDLIFRLSQKQFSGFIDVRLLKKNDNSLLFFHEGKRIGGSYSWGKGGLSVSDEDYNTMISIVQMSDGVFNFGSFVQEEKTAEPQAERPVEDAGPLRKSGSRIANPVYNELRPALEEFLFFYTQVVQKKAKIDPLDTLNVHMLARVSDFPCLDPAQVSFEYSNGVVKFAAGAPAEQITRAVVACAWEVINSLKLRLDFAQELQQMKTRRLFQQKNIDLEP